MIHTAKEARALVMSPGRRRLQAAPKVSQFSRCQPWEGVYANSVDVASMLRITFLSDSGSKHTFGWVPLITVMVHRYNVVVNGI